jgi:hypothetical protein
MPKIASRCGWTPVLLAAVLSVLPVLVVLLVLLAVAAGISCFGQVGAAGYSMQARCAGVVPVMFRLQSSGCLQ